MNLTRLSIQNFRSLYNVELTLKPLTILIGPNASGKSNLFKALRFIYDGVAGEIKDWQAYSAQIDDLLWYGTANGQRPDQVKFVLDFGDSEIRPFQFQYGVIFRTGNYLEVANEWLKEWKIQFDKQLLGWLEPQLTVHELPAEIFLDHRQLREWLKQQSKWDENFGNVVTHFERDGLNIQEGAIEFVTHSSRMLRLRNPDSDTAEEATYGHITGWRFVEANLRAARFAHFIPQYPEEVPPLEGDFSNLSAFLYALHQLQRDDFDTVVDALQRSIELPRSVKIEHDSGRGGQSAHYGFVERAFGEERFIPPESMSDGTIKLLAYLALLLADPTITLACLEEPDVGLHPRMMVHLADAMRQAINREIEGEQGYEASPQIIVTTHSPEFMDCFDLTEEAEYLQVYLVERNELGQTVFTPATADEFAPWLEKYRLGEAVRRRFI